MITLRSRHQPFRNGIFTVNLKEFETDLARNRVEAGANSELVPEI
jgi:hypothetical protein